MMRAGCALALAASQPMVSGVRDFAIAAVINREAVSPFHAGVRSGAADARSHAFFAGDFFAWNRVPVAISGSEAGGCAAIQAEHSQRKQKQYQ
jgi:hypothetical protein